ncbi:MAG: PRC-barrel domain-containing protein [Coriobacteriia bacterium]|nr:PRC-barrel domain-containing protein [Coriobacteriia bacterium]
MAMRTQMMTGQEVFRARRFLGKDVFDVNGDHVGEVEDLVLSVQTGCAQWTIVSTGGVLGIGEKYRIVPIQSFSIEMDTGRLMLDFEGSRLQNAPRYDKDSPPDWSDENWSRSVRSFYGMDVGMQREQPGGRMPGGEVPAEQPQGYPGYERRKGMTSYGGPERRQTRRGGAGARGGQRWQRIGAQTGQGRQQPGGET